MNPGDARDRVAALVTGGGIEFSGVDLLRLRGPVVYLITRAGLPLYVGMSGNGLTRPFNRHHHALDGLQSDDRLQVWPVASVLDARELEVLLIRRLQPLWNRRDLVDVRAIAQRLGTRPAHVRRIHAAARE